MAPFQTGAANMAANIGFENSSDGEIVHQRCVLIIGQCISSHSDEDFLTITTHDASSTTTFPIQNWPIAGKRFKALSGHATGSVGLSLTYIPLLQNPPLHLAIMIAKDSSLIIDCLPHKRGGISSAHSDLDAAINKFRMTAYMWQALTTEDMRSKGLGRRSFRVEEEWSAETLSREFLQIANEASGKHMRSIAKIHLVKSDKTVAELRDANFAQQNKKATRDSALFTFFNAALKAHGGPFASSAHPVVAGLILDSAYSTEQDLILGHAALGLSNPTGVSLGIFGSHLTYSWPRFLEEVPACLMDTAVPGNTVGNDNGECASMWEACSIGQGAFLHEVGHAFGAPHTSGIMARGYAQYWPKNFLPKTAYCAHKQTEGAMVIDGETGDDARWDLCDALSFKLQSHFRLPTDPVLSQEALVAEPSVQVVYDDDEKAEFMRLVISCPSQIVRLKFNGTGEAEPTIAAPVQKQQFTIDELESRFERTQPLKLEVLGMNDKSRTVGDAWKLFSQVSFIRIPGYSILLKKKSFVFDVFQAASAAETKSWDWAVLLGKRWEV
ncbi:putative zinc metalloproteinase [Lachnellula suecica]|uniref:Putative zinc metalloproteinase n=1 Tax=Lachnellula suecica TaxID=602035 RepID=A0A8T9CEQ6_9HELO|nr:putative zinc metalloproteinase [Lachnellula suecica]